MEDYKGVIKIDYLGRVIEIPYSMSMLGGNPHVYLTDKNGDHHSFFLNGEGEWRYGFNKPVGWRKDFLELLYAAFSIEAEKHGL